MLTEPELARPHGRLGQALQTLLRPAVGFSHPMEVLKDPWLEDDDKRAVLSSWASDASAVEGQPTLRWLLGTEAPVPLADVLDALRRLDRARCGRSPGSGLFGRSSQFGDPDHEIHA